ncbi:hypothetical protein OCB07_26625, partial [Bacillus cereus]|nr:hypothetical protein [Bacillus cereus]
IHTPIQLDIIFIPQNMFLIICMLKTDSYYILAGNFNIFVLYVLGLLIGFTAYHPTNQHYT